MVKMEITALGAARQVGRSAFLLKGKRTNVLLDFGVLMAREPVFPIHVQPKDVDAILLSHAHLDHSGATPSFYLSEGVNLYTTPASAEFAKLLIEDFIKISGFYLPFEYIDLMTMFKKTHYVDLYEVFQIGEFTVQFLDAGHIPGSASMVIEADGKRLLYTGDMNGADTMLLNGADTNFGELDAVITESTYALSDHTPRQQVESEFVEYARAVVEGGGTLLVPAFSVGRAQEIACVLRNANFPYPVAMDGMALKANEILMRHQDYLKDPKFFRRTLENVEMMKSWEERKEMVKTPSVIIAPAGMLVGGLSVFYSEKIALDNRNGVAIVAFQIPGTPGRTLLEKGLTLVRGRPKKVKAQVKRFDFSSHSGRKELFDMLKAVKGNPKVMTVHGEEEHCTKFAKEVKQEFGFDAMAPAAGDVMKI